MKNQTKEKQVEHTDLPWHRNGYDLTTIINTDNKQNEFIAWCSNDRYQKDIEKELANAAYIVKACNSHYELVEALEWTIAHIRVIEENFPDKLIDCEQALAKAGA